MAIDPIRNEMVWRQNACRYYRQYLAFVHGRTWKRTKMSSYIADQIQEFLEAKTENAYDILVIETPPQHGKSMTVTETLPSWYLGKHPTHHVIVVSYDSDFAARFCRRNKDKVKKYGKDLFGIEIGAKDQAQEFELSNGVGSLISRGIMSGITGNPGNLIVVDDVIKNMQEADSPTYRSRTWEEWQASVKSRLAANAKVIFIGTPWHEDDQLARVIKNEPNVRVIRLPIEAEEEDPLGRAVGDSLCPEIGKDNRWLASFKASYINDPEGGQRAWTALYNCSPRTEGGNIIHRDWWRFYDATETRVFGTEYISVDATFKDGEDSDFVSIQVWGKLRQDYYLRYCLNQHLDFPGTLAALRAIRAMYPRAMWVLIEDKANGPAIIQTLQHEMYCIAVNPLGGKVARVNAVAPAIESGHVYLPDVDRNPWVVKFIDQWSAFPNGSHDDMVDAGSQALHRMLFSSGETEVPPIPEYEQRMIKAESAFNDPDVLFNPYGESDFDFS